MQSWKLLGTDGKRIPYIVYILGVCYIALLASSIQADVFFSGDAGVKYMVVKQIHAGEGFKYLHVTQPDWVKNLWKAGFFPLIQPFTYPSTGGYIISFPPAFQIISSFFYARFGVAGLYIIPVCSILLLWAWFFNLLNYLSKDARRKGLILFVLIFCSPLTVYAVIYWEHTLAVLLLFSGVVFILKKRSGLLAAVVFGALSGIAVWLRPEALVMNFIYAVAILVQYRKQYKRNSLAFLALMFLCILCFFIVNHFVYGSFLGAHSYQMVEEHSGIYKLLRGIKYFALLNWMLFHFFCIVLFCIPVFYTVLRKKPFQLGTLELLCGIALFYCLTVPFIVPNIGGAQWGPRYLLPVIPIILIILLMAWENKIILLPSFLRIVAIPVIIYSLYLNVYEGGFKAIMYENYNRVKPALEFVKQQQEKVILVDSEFIPMEMSAIFGDRYFFLVVDKNRSDSLNMLLHQQGVKSYIYIFNKITSPGLIHMPGYVAKEFVRKGNYTIGKYQFKP